MTALDDFARRYLEWAEAMQRTHGAALFTFNGSAGTETLGTIAGVAELKEPYHQMVLRLNQVRKLSQPNGTGWYVSALSRASMEFCRANYKGWWV